jgi:hypothetical protein
VPKEKTVNEYFSDLVSGGLSTIGHAPLAAAGTFPAAFTAVYVFGGIAAFAVGFFALKKAREVNASSAEQRELESDDSP